MSILDSFDPEGEAIIEPSGSFAEIADFPEMFLVCFTEQFAALILSMTEAEQIDSLFAGRTIPVYKINYKGKSIGFYHTLVGGAASGALLEETIAKGAKKLLFFGSCGSLDSGITAGKLIVPVAAYRDEGLSFHYAPEGDYIDIPTADALAGIFEEMNVPFVRAKTWTTDAFYRETKRNMEKRKSEGCAAVEMECASVMAVGRFRSIPVFQFLYAADCLDGDGWDRRILGSMPDDMRALIAETALETAIRI